MHPVDPVIARLNAQFEKPTTLLIQTPNPTYHYNLDPDAGPPGIATPSRSSTNPSPSSTLVSSTTTLNNDNGYGLKYFLDFATTIGKGSKNTVGFQLKSWVLVRDRELPQPKDTPYERPFVDFNVMEDRSLKAERQSLTPGRGRPLHSGSAAPNNSKNEPSGPSLEGSFLSVSPSIRKLWASKFEEASQARDLDTRTRCAKAIVSSINPWDEDEMLDLVRAIVWGASDSKIRNTNDHFASLSLALHRSFADLWPKEELELKFMMVLCDAVIGTFLNSWSSESYKAIVYDRSPSVDRAQFAVSSLAHCKFIGSLYRMHLFSRHNLVGCIRVIFNNMSTIEHYLAVHHILFNAGTQLWRGCEDVPGDMADLKANIIDAAKRVQCDHSLLAHQPPFNTVKSTVGYILAQLDGYAQFLKRYP